MKLINRFFSKFGFEFRNLQYLNQFPYKKSYEIFGTEFNCWIPDDIGKKWYDTELLNNFVELELIKKLIEPSDNVLEIGLHYGFFATFIAKNLAEESKYYGVELQPKCAMYTQAQFSLNNIKGPKYVINAAGGASNAILNFSPQENGNASVSMNIGSRIQSITGDSLLELAGKFDIIKIDVEGYEIEVLKGCREILNLRPKIFLEIHGPLIPNFGNKMSEIFDLIDFNNYDGYMYVRPHLKALPLNRTAIKEDALSNIFLFPK